MRKDVHATYIMIGTPPSRYGFDSDDPLMEIDEEAVRRWEENTGGEAVQERLMLLVSEDELEGVSYAVPTPDLLTIPYATDSKSQFYIIDSIDVYSLSAVYLIVRSPTPLHPELSLSGSIYPGRILTWYAKNKTGFGNSIPKIRPESWPRK